VVLDIAPDGRVSVRRPDGAADQAPPVPLDRAELPEQPVPWPPGGELQVGGVLLEVHRPAPPDAAVERSPDGPWLDFNRPPRLLPAARQTTFRLPRQPPAPNRAGLPILG